MGYFSNNLGIIFKKIKKKNKQNCKKFIIKENSYKINYLSNTRTILKLNFNVFKHR